MNNATVNVCVQVLFDYLFLILLGVYIGADLLGHKIILRGAPKMCSAVAAPFCIPTSNSIFSTSSQTFPHRHFCLLFLFNNSHSSGYKVLSHCGFTLHFPKD